MRRGRRWATLGPVTGRRGGDRAVIPLFPLGTVLVPGLVLPLHVFEPRYRRLLADLAAKPEHERGFGVVAIREGHEVGEGGARALHEVGTGSWHASRPRIIGWRRVAARVA